MLLIWPFKTPTSWYIASKSYPSLPHKRIPSTECISCPHLMFPSLWSSVSIILLASCHPFTHFTLPAPQPPSPEEVQWLVSSQLLSLLGGSKHTCKHTSYLLLLCAFGHTRVTLSWGGLSSLVLPVSGWINLPNLGNQLAGPFGFLSKLSHSVFISDESVTLASLHCYLCLISHLGAIYSVL